MNTIKFDLVLEHGLMNSAGDGYHTFFDKDLGCFVMSKNDTPPRKYAKHNMILCPYSIVPNSMVWKKFYEIISDGEREILDSFEGGMGFFEFLRETGIIETHRHAKELVIEEIFEAWLIQNDITIDWDHIVIL